MLPLSDDNRGRKIQPVVTYALIAINVVVWLWQWLSGDQGMYNILDQWAVVPAEITAGQAYYTLLTCAFLHGSWFHLGSNMLFLWIFGDNVEDVMGHARYFVFYLLTAGGASIAQVLVDTDSRIPMVGASGAVSGVLAAYLILFPKGRIRTLIFLGVFITVVMVPAWVMIGLWIATQVISGVGSLNTIGDAGGGVAFFAHIGGFVAGLVLVWFFRDKEKQDRQNAARAGGGYQRQSWGLQPGRRG